MSARRLPYAKRWMRAADYESSSVVSHWTCDGRDGKEESAVSCACAHWVPEVFHARFSTPTTGGGQVGAESIVRRTDEKLCVRYRYPPPPSHSPQCIRLFSVLQCAYLRNKLSKVNFDGQISVPRPISPKFSGGIGVSDRRSAGHLRLPGDFMRVLGTMDVCEFLS